MLLKLVILYFILAGWASWGHLKSYGKKVINYLTTFTFKAPICYVCRNTIAFIIATLKIAIWSNLSNNALNYYLIVMFTKLLKNVILSLLYDR